MQANAEEQHRDPRVSLPSVSMPQWLLAVLLTHGVLDGILTSALLVTAGDTTLESNPLWREAATELYYYFISDLGLMGDIWALTGAVLAVAKLAVVGMCCVAIRRWIPDTRVTRAWLAGLTLLGLLVVLNNTAALL